MQFIYEDSMQLSLCLSQILSSLIKIHDLDEFIKQVLKKLVDTNVVDYSYFTIPETKSFLAEGDFQEKFLEADLSKGSVLILALKIKGKICANLGLKPKAPKSFWSEIEKKSLESFAEEISGIIENIQLINDLKETNEKLLTQDKTKSEVMSTISHELRTPLSNVLGYSELLSIKDFPPEVQKQYIEEIHSSASRLSALVQDFLDLSRIEATGHLQLNSFEECELDFLAESAWKHLSSQTQNHSLEFKINTNNLDELPLVSVDRDAITRVFINLFSNSIKYSPLEACLSEEEKLKRKKILCQIESKKNEILVMIKDYGIGIPHSLLESIFERFFRADNSNTRKIGGTGLGLWISKEIIEAHGGKIWCESKEGLGSNFAFVIPLGDRLDDETQIWLN